MAYLITSTLSQLLKLSILLFSIGLITGCNPQNTKPTTQQQQNTSSSGTTSSTSSENSQQNEQQGQQQGNQQGQQSQQATRQTTQQSNTATPSSNRQGSPRTQQNNVDVLAEALGQEQAASQAGENQSQSSQQGAADKLQQSFDKFDQLILSENQAINASQKGSEASDAIDPSNSESDEFSEFEDAINEAENGPIRDRENKINKNPETDNKEIIANSSTRANVPPDLTDGSGDDIIARQLREAAMKEQDPELRKRLWDEYRKYKKGTGG